MPPEIGKALEKIGLGDKERKVLLALLQHGALFAFAISRETKLNRTTVYGILKELIEKGLVSYEKKGGSTLFHSIEPELLAGYIERQGEELLEIKEDVGRLVPQIKLLRAKGKQLPKVQFFEGEDGVKKAYEDTLENNKEKFICALSGIDAAVNRLSEKWANYYWSKRVRLGIKATVLTPESEWANFIKENDEKHLRVTKYLPARYGFNAEFSLYDNKVGIFSYAAENPVALIIEDETIANAMKQIFAYINSTIK